MRSVRMSQAIALGAATLVGSVAWCVWGVIHLVVVLTAFPDRAFGPENEIRSSRTLLMWCTGATICIVAGLLGCAWGLIPKGRLRFPWLCLAWFLSWLLFHAAFQAATGGNDIYRWRDPSGWVLGAGFAIVAAASASVVSRLAARYDERSNAAKTALKSK